MKKIILIIGISGIGKTTFCSHYRDYNYGICHIVASSHIKFVLDQHGCVNQEYLTKSIYHQIESDPSNIFLIDGHLINNDVPISLEALTHLKLDAIIALIAEPKTIILRRKSDLTRNRKDEGVGELLSQQNHETEYASIVAENLSIPLIKIENPNLKTFEFEVNRLIKN
ncbi:hypothetical protein VIBNISOn1_230026 [Vibrio nigripulchritudo SOn1]|uniref:Adenylate kinase n=1 Tax=Vibrio nigripulchritudo SOn1 TaxID=1238450 RepID=A0AAV2VQZ6_9VIBR|nr:AAA family ATPase [Vibrio nigripulchritudo]CCO47127.1 hypothetical protein VIBNISOn1_230026 [Vibrio nigripulchritudo SOn1]